MLHGETLLRIDVAEEAIAADGESAVEGLRGMGVAGRSGEGGGAESGSMRTPDLLAQQAHGFLELLVAMVGVGGRDHGAAGALLLPRECSARCDLILHLVGQQLAMKRMLFCLYGSRSGNRRVMGLKRTLPLQMSFISSARQAVL